MVAPRSIRDRVQSCRITSNMSVHSSQRKEVRICVFVTSPMIQSAAVLEEVKSPTQRVTVVGDTLSAARDIVTDTRMMCIVTLRARLRTKYVMV
jgi:hypothetical protein